MRTPPSPSDILPPRRCHFADAIAFRHAITLLRAATLMAAYDYAAAYAAMPLLSFCR